MKILFICGSLEPGRDGVGDYTRRLAGELIRQSHQTAVVALNDRHILDKFDGTQEVDGINIPVLRVSHNLPVKKRFGLVKEWIHYFNPAWLSLQFVPFSFHSKGLPFSLGRLLSRLSKDRNWHIMIHELWVGEGTINNTRQKVYAILQKALISRLIKSLYPLTIHTHLPAYRLQLENFGWKVKELPLFSNISLVKKEHEENKKNVFRVGIFSQAKASSSVIQFLICLEKQVAITGMAFEVLLIGGGDTRMRAFGSTLENLEIFRNRVRYTGFLEPRELSWALQSCTLGLTPVPRHALGKSGSVAAFLAHGIPVAAPSFFYCYDSAEIGFFSINLCSSILLTPDLSKLKIAKASALEVKEQIQISSIANSFLSDLKYL